MIPAISSSDANFSTQNAFDVLSTEILNAPMLITTTSKDKSLTPSNVFINDGKGIQLLQLSGFSAKNIDFTTGDEFTSAEKYITNSDTKQPWLKATIKTASQTKIDIS